MTNLQKGRNRQGFTPYYPGMALYHKQEVVLWEVREKSRFVETVNKNIKDAALISEISHGIWLVQHGNRVRYNKGKISSCQFIDTFSLD